MPSVEAIRGGYRVRWRDGGRNSPKQSSPIFMRKPDAEAEAVRISERLAAAKKVRPGSVLRLGELVERWQANRISLGNDPLWTEQAGRAVRTMIKARGWITVTDVTPEGVNDWRLAGGAARNGARLRAVLWWAKDYLDQPIREQVLIALRPPRIQRRPKQPLISTDQLRAWLKYAREISPDCAALLHCLSTYGWRPITATRLTVGDVDLRRGVVRTAVKGGDVVEHPLHAQTIDLLRPLIDGRPKAAALFLDPRSGRAFGETGSPSIHQFFRDWFGGKVYDLKRLAISNMLDRKLAPQDVALFTGHRTLGQVLTYARTNEERARKALGKMVGHRGARMKPTVDKRDRTPLKNSEKTTLIRKQGQA